MTATHIDLDRHYADNILCRMVKCDEDNIHKLDGHVQGAALHHHCHDGPGEPLRLRDNIRGAVTRGSHPSDGIQDQRRGYCICKRGNGVSCYLKWYKCRGLFGTGGERKRDVGDYDDAS